MKNSYMLRLLVALSISSPFGSAQSIDPRGPIAIYRDVQVTREGVALAHAVISHENPATLKWDARWIALPAEINSTVAAVRFRKEITLTSTARPVDAIAFVTADPFYRLWVNGHLVSRGPDDAGSDYSPRERWTHQWLADQVDVGRYLHGGKNVIAAEVFSRSRNLSLGTIGFAFRLMVKVRGESNPLTVESGPDWVVQDATAYSNEPVSRAGSTDSEALLYDARKDERNWRDPDFSTKGWSPARVLTSVWGPITISHLPPMMEAIFPITKISALDVTRQHALMPVSGGRLHQDSLHSLWMKGDGGFLVDYNRVLSGYISLSVKGAPGTRITVWPRERKGDAPGRRPFVLILGRGTTFFESPALESFSSLEIEVTNAGVPVHFLDVRANFVSQPVSYQGSFRSDNERLNALWKASRWQTQVCLQNRFMDSPDHQEPIGDPGDYLIEAKVANYAFGPIALTPQFLRQFAAILDTWMANHPDGSPNFHTSYSLLWLQTLLEYYDETGDVSLATELAPTAYRLLARYAEWIGPNGILSEAPNYLFMDWVTIGGFPTHHPPAVIGQGYLTAFYYRGIADGQRLAELTGDSARIAKYTKQRANLCKAFNQELWDARVGLYRDGKPFLNHNPTSPDFLPPDRDIETHSPHVNVLAVLYDLAPPQEQAKILEGVFTPPDADIKKPVADDEADDSGLLNVQPYFMHFVFAAEVHAGVFAQYAPSQLARWVVNPQTQTFEESWNRGDWSHGWGATPLLQMSSHVLGVSARSPGYATVLLAPIPITGLSFAKGIVPTPKGNVTVSWFLRDHQFVYETTLPQATSATLDLEQIAGKESMRVKVDRTPAVPYSGPIGLSAGHHLIVLSPNGGVTP
jgi:alpha-L-rhamnosidase